MSRHCRLVSILALFLLLSSVLPAAAQPNRAEERAGLGRRWIELWQSVMAPFTVLTGEGRAIWDPNGGDSEESTSGATSGATSAATDDTEDGRTIWDPNGLFTS